MASSPDRRFVLLVLLILVSGASCAGWWWGTPLLAHGGDHLKVPHDIHRAAKVDCVACHDAVWDSKELGDPVLPKEKQCLQCHKDRQNDCKMCHTTVKARGRVVEEVQPQTLRMSHADHIARVKEDCTVCHKQLPNPMRSAQSQPKMDACLGCHEHAQEFQEGRCAVCHLDLARYGPTPLGTFTHAGDFVREHMRAARSAPETCASCHDQTFCSDCHNSTVGLKVETKFPERVDRDFIHRNDFISRHAIEQKADPASCARCHGTSFCETCHTAQNLTALGSNPRSPHPAGFTLPGSTQFHGLEARRDIASCASCHDQGAQSNCVGCHKVGGIGGNPHPIGYESQHPHSEIARNGMCAYCHAP
jgi:hypothetical protein